MKKILLATVIASVLLLSGCAHAPYQPGFLYTNATYPVAVTNNSVSCQKHGTSKATNILGLISTGDASIAAAKADAGITTVGAVDVHYKNILGIYAVTTTEVCGR